MIDIPKFKSPSFFCLAVGLSILAWYYTSAFMLIDKFIPLDFSAQEELLMSNAELKLLEKNEEAKLTIATAKYEAAKYKRDELQKLIDSSFKLHGLSLKVGLFFLFLSIPAFCLEMAWQRSVFNKALKSDADKKVVA